jgi:predicted transcriptional regulator
MIEETLGISKNGEKNHALKEMMKTIGAECRNCAPLTPLDCITRCNVWKLKNELRTLRGTMDNPNFIKELFNVLKNNTRLHILRAIVKGRHSVIKLQEQLKKAGYTHSQETINEEYLRPLIAVGLAAEAQEQYYATMFGGRLNDLLEEFPDFVEILPAHSECYEEKALDALLSGPKTFDDMEACISPKIASRILKRLKTVDLIDAPEERDYVFFFQSKRDPDKENFAETEKKVYENIPSDGVSAKKLADDTGISLRRTYKYLRGLKGKKLVFTRKTPKEYTLTSKGEKLASLLRNLQGLVDEVWQSSEQVVSAEKS